MDLSTIYQFIEPEVLNQVLGSVALVLYLTGRITRKQFMAEQKKQKGIILPKEAKKVVANEVSGVVGKAFDLVDKVPVVNKKLPLINMSVPQLAKGIVTGPLGLLSDIILNAPVVGNKVKTDM